MDVKRIDAIGLRCPQPVLKLAMDIVGLPPGALVEIVGDCPTFEADIRSWCDRRSKTILTVRPEGTTTVIQIKL